MSDEKDYSPEELKKFSLPDEGFIEFSDAEFTSTKDFDDKGFPSGSNFVSSMGQSASSAHFTSSRDFGSSQNYRVFSSSKDFESISSLADFALDSGSADSFPSYGTMEIEQDADHSGVSVELLRATHRLLSTKPEGSAQTVLFVSTSIGEGKSLILNHLAYSCAGVFGKRVLIIDLQETPDLMSVDNSLEAMPDESFSLRSTDYFNLQRMILNLPKSRMYKFLQEHLPKFSEQYDMIMVEAPALYAPIAPDPIVLSTLFIEILLIFRPTQTPSANIQETVTLLKQAGVHKPLLFINDSQYTAENSGIFRKVIKRLRAIVRFLRSSFKKNR